MTRTEQLTRRRFLGVTAATAGGGLLANLTGWGAATAAAPTASGETEHFSYRLQPRGLYIDSQNDHMAFGYANGRILLSEDNAHTWPHSLAFPDAQRITFSSILRNGNVLFATGSKLYLSTDKLQTYREVKVKAPDGSDYVPHTPRNPNNPGWYFHTIVGDISWNVKGAEMLVWGNYCNVIGGATPINIYYSTDHGQTVKIAYSFGQNPYLRDNGEGGGGATGTLLGNPDNPVICRHLHNVSYNPAENAFYACTGDHDRTDGYECHWLKGTYEPRTDKWHWTVLTSARMNSRYKTVGVLFVDGKFYWASDANVRKPFDRGIFRCDPADLLKPENHELLYMPEVEIGSIFIQNRMMFATHCAPATPLNCGFIVSRDLGKTWAQYDLKELGKRTPTRWHAKNGEGWLRLDLRSGWVDRADVLFIKPKEKPAGAGSWARVAR